MNKDEIIRIAVQCQLVTTGNRDGFYMEALERFAAIVAAAEREQCANVCDDIFRHWIQTDPDEKFATPDADDCARAIRARGETK